MSYGLWSVVQESVQPEGDSHWRNGIMFLPDQCEPAHSTMDGCPPPDVSGDPDAERTKIPTGLITTVGTDALTVYAWVDCGPVGGVWEEATARAQAALIGGEARAVEHAFWTGEVTHPTTAVYHPHLASDEEVTDPGDADPAAHQTLIQRQATVPDSEDPMDLAEGLGWLEGRMAGCYPGVPTIHVPRIALAEISAHSLATRQGPQLRTLSGSLVAAGAGYPGTAPDGTTPEYPVVWLYATGAVVGRRSEITISSREVALDRRTNRLVLIPERTYVLGWDCCLFGVPVHLGGITAGAGASPAGFEGGS